VIEKGERKNRKIQRKRLQNKEISYLRNSRIFTETIQLSQLVQINAKR